MSSTTTMLRETWGTDAITGEVREVFHLPANSWLPLVAALTLAAVCICLLVRAYPLALVASVVALVLLLRWSWVNGAHPGAAPLSSVEPAEAPLHSRTRSGPGLWGMAVALMADGTLYLSLLFGWFYLWTVAPEWSIPEQRQVALIPLFVCGAVLTIAVLWFRRELVRLDAGNTTGLALRFTGIAALGLVHVAGLTWLLQSANLEPSLRAHDSVLSVVFGYLLLHSSVAVILTVMQARRVALGYVSARLPYEPQVLRLFWNYTLGIFWTAFAAFFLFPLAWGTV